MSSAPLRLCIVICTFHREILLAKALRSVFAQAPAPDAEVSIIVSDNSDAGTARDAVLALTPESPFPLRWIAAHPANISVARNAAVHATNADFIAFLDDDQETQPGWLKAIASAVSNAPFDAHFGRVEAHFETPDATTPVIRQLFSRILAAPRGTEVIAMGSAKTKDIALATNNSVFRRTAMLIGPGPFDPAFGTGGGEDYDLICRMAARGSRFGWIPEAVVSEFVPAARCEPAYLRRRFYAGGQAFAAAIANASPAPRRSRWMTRLKALAQAILVLARTPLAAWRGREALTDHSFVLAGVLGKIAFGGIHAIYGNGAASAAGPVAE